jgi:hypothetical protein
MGEYIYEKNGDGCNVYVTVNCCPAERRPGIRCYGGDGRTDKDGGASGDKEKGGKDGREFEPKKLCFDKREFRWPSFIAHTVTKISPEYGRRDQKDEDGCGFEGNPGQFKSHE